MSQVHFFTDLSVIDSSNEVIRFGPASSSIYNLVTLFSSQAENAPKAYSVCKGLIRYQEDRDDVNLVNAILQVADTPTFQGLPIKYIVYRGIRKDSLLETATAFHDVSTLPDNHISKILRADNLADNEDHLRMGLGIQDVTSLTNGLSLPDQEPLENLFNNNYGYSSFLINPGVIIGEFQTGSAKNFGIEIILDTIFNGFQVEWVRDSKLSQGGRKLDTAGLSGTILKNYKEKVLSFLDPVCLWTSQVKKGILTPGSPPPLYEDDVYDDIIAPHYTSPNRIYIDLREENGFSLNYFDRYTGPLALEQTSTSSLLANSFSTLGWPLLILDDLPNFTSIAQFVNFKQDSNLSSLRLSFPVESNTKRLAYCNYAAEGEESGAELQEPKMFTSGERFRSLKSTRQADDGSSGTITVSDSITLGLFKTNPNATSDGLVLGTYVRLSYFHQNTVGNGLADKSHYLDNAFIVKPLLEYTQFYSSSNTTSYLTDRLIFIDRDGGDFGLTYPGMYQVGVSFDASRVHFYLSAVQIIDVSKRVDGLASSFVSDNTSFFEAMKGSTNDMDFSVKRIVLNAGTAAEVDVLKMSQTWFREVVVEEWLPVFGLANNFESFDDDTFLCVSLGLTEYNNIVSPILSQYTNINNELEGPVFLKMTDTPQVSSTDNINYSKSALTLCGYHSTNSSILNTSVSLDFFTVDGKLYATSLAASAEGEGLASNVGFKIMHDQASSDLVERERFRKLNNAISLLKIFAPSVYNQVKQFSIRGNLLRKLKYRVDSFDDPRYSGIQKAVVVAKEFETSLEYIHLELSISSGSEFKADIAGETLPRDFVKVTVPDADGGPDREEESVFLLKYRSIDDTENQNDPKYGIYTQYYNLSLLDQANYKTPSQIAEEFNPTLSFNTGQDETGVVRESYELHSMPNIGFAEREGNIKIRINEDSYNSPNMLGEITSDVAQVSLYENLDLAILKGFTWQELQLCHVLSHEIGHALFEISHPIVDWIWDNLESYSYRLARDGETATHKKEYRDDNNDGVKELYYVEDSSSSATHVLTKIRQAYDIPFEEYRKNKNRLNYLYSTNLPHYPGGGHLEGNPSGIWTFAFDKILSKSLFENFIWARVDEVYKKKLDEINESSMSQQWKDDQKDVLSQNRAFIKTLSVPGYLEPVVDNQEPPQPTGGYRLNTYYLGASDSK